MASKLHTLVFSEDLERGADLLESVSQGSNFSSVYLLNSLEEGTELLNRKEHLLDLIFVDSEGDPELLSAFLLTARSSRRGQDSAYILAFSATSLDDAISDQSVPEVDGFLFTPYSVATAEDYSTIVEAVKSQRENEREVPALEFLLEDAAYQIDHIASEMASGKDSVHKLRYLDSIKTALNTSKKDLRGLYFNLAITEFTK